MKKSDEKAGQIIDWYEKISSHANITIDKADKFYKRTFWGLTVVLTIGIGAIGFMAGKEWVSISKESKQKIDDALSKQISTVEMQMKETWANEKQKIEQRIKAEFSKAYIDSLVATEAQNRVDAIADSLISIQVETKIGVYSDLYYHFKAAETNSDLQFGKHFGFLTNYYQKETDKKNKLMCLKLIKKIKNIQAHPYSNLSDDDLIKGYIDKSIDTRQKQFEFVKAQIECPYDAISFSIYLRIYNYLNNSNIQPWDVKIDPSCSF